MLTIMSCITLLIIAITGVLYFNYQDKKEEKNKYVFVFSHTMLISERDKDIKKNFVTQYVGETLLFNAF